MAKKKNKKENKDCLRREKILRYALQNSRQITQKMSMVVSDAIIITDPFGNIMFASGKAASLYGIDSADKLIDCNIKDFIVPEQRAFLEENISRVFSEGFLSGIEYTVSRFDGSRFYAGVTAASVTVQNKRPVAIVCAIRDLTGVKKNERAVIDTRETYLSIFEGVNDAIIVIDPVIMKITDANERFFILNGIKKEGHKEIDISVIAKGGSGFTCGEFAENVRIAMDKGECVFEWKTMASSGESVWYEVSLKRAMVTGSLRVLGIMRDITHKKFVAEELEKSFKIVKKIMSGIIQAMEKLVEKKDEYTVGHQKRTGILAKAIAVEMGLPAEQINSIYISAVIHDIGKIFISGSILNKKGKLDESEYEEIKKHPDAGYEILSSISFPWPVAEIVRQHHERLDGSGYPMGLKGEEIYLESRIISIADVVEAITFARPYREAYGIEAALQEIINGKGKLYDPEIVDVCVKLFREKGFVLSEKENENGNEGFI